MFSKFQNFRISKCHNKNTLAIAYGFYITKMPFVNPSYNNVNKSKSAITFFSVTGTAENNQEELRA